MYARACAPHEARRGCMPGLRSARIAADVRQGPWAPRASSSGAPTCVSSAASRLHTDRCPCSGYPAHSSQRLRPRQHSGPMVAHAAPGARIASQRMYHTAHNSHAMRTPSARPLGNSSQLPLALPPMLVLPLHPPNIQAALRQQFFYGRGGVCALTGHLSR